MTITRPEQVEVRGLLLGPGTDYYLEDLDRLTERTAKRSDFAIAGATGSVGSRRFAAQTTRTLRVALTADSFDDWDEFDDACTALLTAWKLDDVETPVSYRESGTRVMRVYGFTDGVDEIVRTAAMARYQLELVCVDPLRYSDTAETIVLDPGDSETIDNEGNASSSRWAAAFAAGPVGAKLAHEDGAAVDFDGYTLAAALTADGHDWQVRNGATRVVPLPIVEASEFFTLPAGESDITFSKDSGSDGTCTFSWRSAWL